MNKQPVIARSLRRSNPVRVWDCRVVRRLTPRNDNKVSGFTLVELLVVISIIGILAALSMASFSTSQKQARDTQRKSDLNQYRIALENYAAANSGVYPVHAAANVNTICPSSLSTNFIASCPTDPVNNATYFYQYISNASGSDYQLWVTTESGGIWEVCSSGKSGKAPAAPTGVCNVP